MSGIEAEPGLLSDRTQHPGVRQVTRFKYTSSRPRISWLRHNPVSERGLDHVFSVKSTNPLVTHWLNQPNRMILRDSWLRPPVSPVGLALQSHQLFVKMHFSLKSYCKTLYMTFNREPISHDRSVPQRVGETPRNSCRFARSTVAIGDDG